MVLHKGHVLIVFKHLIWAHACPHLVITESGLPSKQIQQSSLLLKTFVVTNFSGIFITPICCIARLKTWLSVNFEKTLIFFFSIIDKPSNVNGFFFSQSKVTFTFWYFNKTVSPNVTWEATVSFSTENVDLLADTEDVLHPKLNVDDNDLYIGKREPNAFIGTNLKKELDSRKLKKLVIVGIWTHNCVQATCKGAKKLDYDVILVRDGHSQGGSEKEAKKSIESWNSQLSKEGIKLIYTNEINF